MYLMYYGGSVHLRYVLWGGGVNLCTLRTTGLNQSGIALLGVSVKGCMCGYNLCLYWVSAVRHYII